MYYLFLDESGDHGLANINPHFPVFLLCDVLFERAKYEECRDKINEIKQAFWNTKEVIFHSSDLRRLRKEFQIFFDLDLKGQFYTKFNEVMKQSDYIVIADGIHKEEYIRQYGKLSNVYELCLSFTIERAYFYLHQKIGQQPLYIIIEERGKKEDRKLKEYFWKVIDRGTHYLSAQQMKSLNIKLEFRAKKSNINGLQLADFIAYPIARYVMDKKRANPAFDIIRPKIYQKNGKLYGLKTYP